MLAMSITPHEISRVTFFHLIFYSSWLKEKLTGERLSLTSTTSPPILPNRKDIATTDDEDDEKTEVIYGVENVIQKGLQQLLNVKQRADLCAASDGPSVIVATKPMLNAYIEAKKRGVIIRYITEIRKENISHCKEIMKFAEVRHLDKVKGHMGVSETQYGASAVAEEGKRLTQLIHSNVKAFVEQQQYFFETLWNKAIPAEQRIREIEEGIKPEVIETIREPKVTQERVFELIKSAKEEILVIFSTSNAFRRQEKAGAIDALIGLAKSKNVKIRILSPFDNYVRNIVDRIKREDRKVRIEIRNIEEPLQTKVSVLIVDRTSLLSAELKNDSKETTLEAIGLATYSNSKPTVLSYASIFESLWNQTELYEHIRYLYEQLKSHDKMKQEFMDIAAHELRTPIQPILGLAQVLKEQISDSSQITFLDVILRNAKRLQKLQEEMLDVTRIESGSMQIYKESFNLNELVFDVLQDFRTQLKYNPKIKLNYKSDGDVWIVADKNRIMQVMSNLLTNAIKFTKAGRIFVQLRMKKSKKIADNNHRVIVSIKDEGPGIDSSMMPRLFTKFASKSEKGTGLGLFISKSIVEAYGGRIWAKNNTGGKGATFAFTLPIQKPQQEQ
jgi:signal transduction histidine kinase